MDNKQLLQIYFSNKDFKEYVDKNESWNEDLFTYWECFKLYEKKVNIKNKKLNKESKFCFITIQDFKRRLTDLDKLKQFIKQIEYLYCECYWCIESGKVAAPDSNLHIHILCKIINPKKHKNKLNLEWMKLFPDNSLYDKDYYKLNQWRESEKMPPYDQWLNEKIQYFEDEKKGSHSNSVDLNCRGSWGVD